MTTEQPTGNLYAPLNRYKTPGDDKPMFSGRLTKPGQEAEFPFSLWAFKYTDKKTGEIKTGYGGSISGVPANIPALDQIEALLADPTGADVKVANLNLRPGQIVLFQNGFKDENPAKDRPDQWGWVNPTDGTPPFKASAWIKQYEDSNRPYLSGETQYPLPDKTAEQQHATLDDLIANEHISKGMPKTKVRKEREGRE